MVSIIAEIHDGVCNDAPQGEFGQRWLGADGLVDDASPRPQGPPPMATTDKTNGYRR